MFKFQVFAVLAMLAVVPGAANAGFVSGSDLQKQCADTKGRGYHFCTGYILGVYDGVEHVLGTLGILSGSAAGSDARLCVPPGTQSNEVVASVVEYLNAPEVELSLPASVTIEQALRYVFSCPS